MKVPINFLSQARLRRAAELSISFKNSEKRQKCHWDFVLEEMAWMANDFMQVQYELPIQDLFMLSIFIL